MTNEYVRVYARRDLLDWQCHLCLSCTVEEDSFAILQGGPNGF